MADKAYLDWPFFEARHAELEAKLDAWAFDHVRDVHGPDVDTACRQLVRLLGEAGWLRHAIAGIGEAIDTRAIRLIRETLARHDGLADFAFAMQGLGSGTISLFGSEAQKQAHLPAVASGEKIAAFALTEPGAGSDAAAMETMARAAGEDWVVDGAKTYISNGGIADFYILFARTGEAPGAKGISAFIVDAGTEGLDASERIEVIAPHPLATL